MKRAFCVKAFSLIELLTVVAIIAILAGLVLGGMTYMQNKAMEARCRAHFELVQMAIEAYKADHGHYPLPPPGSSRPPDGSSLQDFINWRNDNLKTNGAATLYRALVYHSSYNNPPKNDFGKAYLYDGQNAWTSGQNKFMVDEQGRIVQSGRAGAQAGAYRLANPNGNVYEYRCPGVYNKGGYDLWTYGPLGKAYYNWRQQ
ncbi:MAG: type II secretion system GspH family protein [Verrucomicrobiae bacterium]|nr:type II secretion system GspH family protein [Verrucomicrobiae bacterium]